MAAPHDGDDEVVDVNDTDTSFDMNKEKEERKRIETNTVKNYVPGIRAFQLTSTSEKVTISRYVNLRFRLDKSEFVISNYGLPFMPIPEPRNVNNSSKYRALPRHVDSAIVTHPIYWTDREIIGEIPNDLTSENAQRWLAKMFGFLLLCGYYTSSYEVKNYLLAHHHDVLDSDGNLDSLKARQIKTYLDGLGAATEFDDIPYLTYDSIVVDPQKRGFDNKKDLLDDFVDKLIDKCEAVFDNAKHKMFVGLSAALEETDKFLFTNGGTGDVSYDFDSRRSYWNDTYADLYHQMREDYRKILQENSYTTLIESQLRSLTENIEKDVRYMDNLSSVIIGPVLEGSRKLSPETIASLQSYNRLAVDTAESQKRFNVTIRDVLLAVNPNVNQYVTEEEQEEEQKSQEEKAFALFDEYMKERMDAFSHSWERLFLCRANYDRVYNKQEIFESYNAAKWQLQTSR